MMNTDENELTIEETRERLQLFERRYNQEHQRGLNIELAGQRAENRVAVLSQALDVAQARIAELELQMGLTTPMPVPNAADAAELQQD